MTDRPTALRLRAVWSRLISTQTHSMDISREEQRILHALAQGGHIHPIKDPRGKIVEIECYTRDGWILTQCDLALFRKLRRRKTIASLNAGPYRITRRGITLVRGQPDNR